MTSASSAPQKTSDSSPLEAAALYYALGFGWRIIPLHSVRDGRCTCSDRECDPKHWGKHPRTRRGLTEASADPEQIHRWWTTWPDAPIGIATDGIAVIDIDPRDGGDESWAELERIHGRVSTVEAISGGEDRGRHLYFEDHSTLRSLNGLAPGVDLKARGGYVIAPPSLHRSGRRYEWEVSSRPTDVPLAPLPEWIRELRTKQNARMRETVELGDRIPTGFRRPTLTSLAGSMRRRGMTEAEMCAALMVTNAERCDPPLLEPAVRHIAHTVANYEPADAPYFPVTAAPDPDEEPAESTDSHTEPSWPTPRPLTAARELPTFPTDALPPTLREFVEAEALATQTPRDMAAIFALGIVATVAGGRAVVEPVPDWTEGLNVYVAAVMEPGSRKSAVERDAKAPIVAYEHELAEKERLNIAEAASRKRVAEGRREKAEKAAATAKPADRFGLEQEALSAARAAEEIVVPAPPRLFTQDATPEALSSLLAAHRRISVLSAEGGIFDLMAGRYSNGVPNIDVFLSGHAGDTLRVDRRNRPPEFVDRPALTMGLAVQPFVLGKIGRNAEMSGRGLLARFLYAVPPGNVGYRSSSPPPVPDSLRARYASLITRLATSLALYETEPYVLKLEPAALDALTAWREELEPRRRPEGDLGAMQAWASKLDGATVRIAGLLHLATHVTDGFGRPIDVATMDAAIRIARYLVPHAATAFDHMGVDGPLEDARRILRWIVAGRRRTFSRRECHRAHESHFTRAEDLEPALELLVDHGWVRPADDGRKPGRPSRQYVVNPEMFTTKPTQTTKPPQEATARPSFVGSVGFVVSDSARPFNSMSLDDGERPSS